MRQLETKFNKGSGTPFTLDSAEWNDAKDNLNRMISSVGLSFITNDANQLSEAIRYYGSGLATFYTVSGSSNAYVLTHVSGTVPATSYRNGMTITFQPNHLNTGAATVNVSGLGVKALRDPHGLALSAGALSTNELYTAIYNSTTGNFRIAWSATPFNSDKMIRGLTASNNATDADHDIDFTVGSAICTNANATFRLTSAMTKQFDTTWAAGSGAGGLLTGSLPTSGTIHVYGLVNPTSGAHDIGAVPAGSAIASNLPSGYEYYVRLCSLITDGSANILAFYQVDNQFILKELITEFTGAPPAYGNLTTSLPTGIQVAGRFRLVVNSATSASAAVAAGPVASISNIYEIDQATEADVIIDRNFETLTDSSARIRHGVATGSDTFPIYRIHTLGWRDITRGIA